jgi:spore germination cell wall hydrolase CwlJ-like protein
VLDACRAGRPDKKTENMKIEKSNAQAQRPARKTLTLFKQLPAAEARRVAYEAALAVIG